MGKPSMRELQRKRLNADFMRMNGYNVEDNPTLNEEDKILGINQNRRPDYRIDGKIYDSYAPKVTLTDWDEREDNELKDGQRYLAREHEWNLDKIVSYSSDCEAKAWKNILRNFICERIQYKVASGQAPNILLNLSDIAGGEELLCDNQLATKFEGITSLESVVCIFRKKAEGFRGITKGEGTTWENLLPCDMAAVHWTREMNKAMARFVSLHNFSASTQPYVFDRSKYVMSKAVAGEVYQPGILLTWIAFVLGTTLKWTGPMVGMLLTGIGAVVTTTGAAVGFLSKCLSSKDSKTQQKLTTKSSEFARKLYRVQMLPLVRSCTNTQLYKAHNDMKVVVKKLIPAFTISDKQIEKMLHADYQILLMGNKVCTIFDNSIKPLFTACLLFIYIASRAVDTLITMVTKKAALQGQILGCHLGLLAFCSTAQHLFHLVFSGILSGPLKLIFIVCVVSMVIWLLHECTGYFATATSGIKYISQVLWIKTEKDYMEVTKLTFPKRASVTMVTSGITYVYYWFLKTIGDVITNLGIPLGMFTPWNFFVKMFGYLGNVLLMTSLLMLILLFILALDTAFPRNIETREILKRQKVDYKGTTVNSLLDSLWKEVEGFIKSKPYEDNE